MGCLEFGIIMLGAARSAAWRGYPARLAARLSQNTALTQIQGWRGSALMAGFKHRPKEITPESYVKFTEIVDGQVVEKVNQRVEDLFEVRKPQKDSKVVPRGLKASGSNVPVPCSPVLGPVTVNDPEVYSKKYKWCACGMSSKQVVHHLTKSLSVT